MYIRFYSAYRTIPVDATGVISGKGQREGQPNATMIGNLESGDMRTLGKAHHTRHLNMEKLTFSHPGVVQNINSRIYCTYCSDDDAEHILFHYLRYNKTKH
ncbi:hypothetical protein JTB14_006791 [Gonioctena quinquepunctata]|nr:hypothetical protein JTB14_006791 [Gonioctena quinquepunctata]